jgi:uncharacterized protein
MLVIYAVIDMDAMEGFEWDGGNSLKSFLKHGVGAREGEEIFFNAPLVLEDAAHSGVERRLHALGETHSGRLLHVSFTIRQNGRILRVISARPMSRKERRVYGKEA